MPEDPTGDRAAAMPGWQRAVGTALTFAVGPGLVVVVLPYAITRWHADASYPAAVRVIGVLLIVVGGVLLVASFAWFPTEGGGTPFPTDPPSSRQVLVGGPYRYVRNPMYVALVVADAGQALLFGRPMLLIYTAVLLVVLVAFVRLYEEPALVNRFGAQYEAYRRRVPGWWPRLPR